MSAATPNSPRTFLPSLAVAACGAVWGCYWAPLHWLEARGMGGAWAGVVFSTVTVFTVLPWLLRRGIWRGFAGHLVTGTLLGLAFALYTVSLVLTDVIHAILLFYMTPVWSTIAGTLLYGERFTARRLLAILLGFAGLALILSPGQSIPWPRQPGDWIALASGMLWAAGTLRSFHRPAPGVAMPVFTFALGGGAASLAILIAAAAAGAPLAALGQPALTVPAAVVAGLVVFVPPNALVLWAAQKIDSGRVGILLMTEVVMGAVTSALFSGQHFGAAEAIGTTLVIAAGLTEVIGRGVK